MSVGILNPSRSISASLDIGELVLLRDDLLTTDGERSGSKNSLVSPTSDWVACTGLAVGNQ